RGAAAPQKEQKPIAFRAGGGYLFGANGVEPGVADGDEQPVALRREPFADPFERQHGPAPEFRAFEVGAIDREADDLAFGIMGEVEIRQFCDLAGPKDDDLLLLQWVLTL